MVWHERLSRAQYCREGSEGSNAGEGDHLTEGMKQLHRALSVEINIESGTSAHTAILQATELSSDDPSIVDLPKWLRMPNKYAQNWIFYSLLSFGAFYGGLFLFKYVPFRAKVGLHISLCNTSILCLK